MYHTNSNMYYRTAGLELQGFYYQLLLEIVLYFTEEDRVRETLIWLVKKVSFLKIFPPSLESSSWCSESILKIRLYLLYLFLLVQVGGLRFQTFVYQQKLSFRSISNIFLEQ